MDRQSWLGNQNWTVRILRAIVQKSAAADQALGSTDPSGSRRRFRQGSKLNL